MGAYAVSSAVQYRPQWDGRRIGALVLFVRPVAWLDLQPRSSCDCRACVGRPAVLSFPHDARSLEGLALQRRACSRMAVALQLQKTQHLSQISQLWNFVRCTMCAPRDA